MSARSMYLALLAAAIVIGCVLHLLDAGVAGFGSARDVGETIGMVAAAFLVAALVPTMAVLLFHKRMGSAAAPTAIGIAVLLVFSHLSYRGMEVQRASTSFPFKAPGCTFSASFPEPPEVRELFLAGGLVVTQANLYSDTLLRAECLSTGERLAPTEEAVLAELGQHAHRDGLMDVEFEVSDMDGFVSGVVRGWKTVSGTVATYEVHVLADGTSIMSLVAGGPSTGYPQPGIYEFLNSGRHLAAEGD